MKERQKKHGKKTRGRLKARYSPLWLWRYQKAHKMDLKCRFFDLPWVRDWEEMYDQDYPRIQRSVAITEALFQFVFFCLLFPGRGIADFMLSCTFYDKEVAKLKPSLVTQNIFSQAMERVHNLKEFLVKNPQILEHLYEEQALILQVGAEIALEEKDVNAPFQFVCESFKHRLNKMI